MGCKNINLEREYRYAFIIPSNALPSIVIPVLTFTLAEISSN